MTLLPSYFRFLRRCAALVAITSLAVTAVARPLDTDDTGTAAPGTWEIEGGVDFVRAGGIESFALTPVFAYGLTERVQLDLACDYLMEFGTGAEADARSLRPAVQVKSRFWQSENSGLSVGMKSNFGRHVHVSGPRGELKDSGHLRMLMTKRAGIMEFDFNAGYDFTGGWGNGDDAWMVAAGLRCPVASTVTAVAEVFTTLPEHGGQTSAMIAVGGKFAARRGWTFDVLFGTGLNSAGPDFRMILGFVRLL